MRDIKFRAWDGEKMRILDQQYIGVGQAGWSNTHYVDLSFYDNEPDTILMQYTGLKDKNGVEIYEGDIYRDKHGDSYPVEWYQDKNAVGFLMGYRDEPVEVIGNIYQNPDLLR